MILSSSIGEMERVQHSWTILLWSPCEVAQIIQFKTAILGDFRTGYGWNVDSHQFFLWFYRKFYRQGFCGEKKRKKPQKSKKMKKIEKWTKNWKSFDLDDSMRCIKIFPRWTKYRCQKVKRFPAKPLVWLKFYLFCARPEYF